MKRFISIVSLLFGVILLTGGCIDLNNKKGSLIHFTTATDEVATKTVYGGDASGYQRIEWVKNDEIFVVSNVAKCIDGDNAGKHYATYVIDGVTNEGHLSYATIAPQPNGLVWGDEQYYDFYAATPAPSLYGVTSITGPDNLPAEPTDDDLASIGTVQCALLQSQSTSGSSTSGSTTVFAPDMRYAPMTAAALGVDKDDAEDVSLVFNPAFTAIEVNMTSDEELTINKVELSSTGTDYLSGVYFLKAGSDISASGAVTVSDTRRFNTVSLSGLNQQVSQDAGINFTLFTIPKVNTGVITLSVQTQTGSGNTLSTATAHLPLKYSNGSVLQFQPGKKYRINALKLSDSWKIFFAVGVDEWVELDPVNIGIE